MQRFKNREVAGQILSKSLTDLKKERGIVLALPRGGVPVAYQIAKRLEMPLTVCIVRKLTSKSNPEYAFGAIAEGGTLEVDQEIVKSLDLTQDEIKKIIDRESLELEKQVQKYRETPLKLDYFQDVIIVDDGVATALTARVACKAIKKLAQSQQMIFASPVCLAGSKSKITPLVDRVICESEPWNLNSVGAFYKSFDQITDAEVIKLLDESSSINQRKDT